MSDLFSPRCGHSHLVPECYTCFCYRVDRIIAEREDAKRAAEAHMPTTARPCLCATRGDHPVGWCSIHNRRLELCRTTS